MGHQVKSRGGNRLKYQIEQCINSINKVGVSKRTARKNGGSQIHSYKQLKEVLSVSQNFGKWLLEQEVKDLFRLKKVHYLEYIDYMQQKEVSYGHLINIETNLRLLNKGMKHISIAKGYGIRVWIPKQRIIDTSNRENPVNRSITDERASEVYERLSNNAKIGMNLQMAFGLRLKEASSTTKAFIIQQGNEIFWAASDDSLAVNPAKGVTKGGRARKTQCRPDYEERIKKLLSGKSDYEYLVPIHYNSLKSAYYRAGLIEGSHGLRHTYARYMLNLEFKKYGIELEGRRMMTQMIENRAAGYRKDHLVSAEQRELYDLTNKIMDTIHGYLGHGSNRTDLAEVYLTE
ncbi:integrase [Viridibacillus sp. FSL E2-0187]|uniref:integrase n=1 Tax=Viridibacillus sp. FSL E2-0187 TaxID=2921362 RepID=UPI0030F6FFA7